MEMSGPAGQITDEWVEQHFDHLSPELAREFHPTLARARSRCPVAHSDAYGGFWVVTRYEDVLRIAQDWRTFSSELGITVPAGERVIIYWASANRDEAAFTAPDAFDLDRPTNPHIAFGAGPHRCVGSNLARMNLRVAIDEVVRRLGDLKLQPGADIGFHSAFNRAPLSVPITFTPGQRSRAS